MKRQLLILCSAFIIHHSSFCLAATHVWQGDATAVAQVDTVQITGFDAATTYTLTIGGRTVSVAGDTDVNTTAAALSTAWNASTTTEVAEITASVATDTVTLTADTAGVPHTVTSSVAGGAGTIGAVGNSTANAGPAVWAAANFDTGSLPANADTVIFENSDQDCLYGLDQNAVTLTLLTIRQSFTGDIGLPRTNSADYVEYREQYLTISSTTAKIGEGKGNGSRRIKLNVGTVQTALTVYNKGSRVETAVPSLLFKGTHAANVLNLLKGDVGVAFFGGETAVIATLKIAYIGSQSTDAALVCGSGTTLTTITVDGGDVELNSNLVTLNQTAGKVTLRAAATVTTWNLDGGQANYASTGTMTTVNVGSGSILDFRKDPGARTVTNCNLYQGAAVHDPLKTVTWTNGLDLVRCSPLSVMLNIGTHQTITPSGI